MSALGEEMNVTSQAQPFYTFTNNVIRKVFIDENYEILNKDANKTLNIII